MVKPTATNDLLLESKPDMRKRGVRSPDKADAFVLTYADMRHIKDFTDRKETGKSAVHDPDAPAVKKFHGSSGRKYGWMR
jgi:hypothetical protein